MPSASLNYYTYVYIFTKFKPINTALLSSLQRFLKDTIIYGIAAVLPRAINILLVNLHTSKLQADTYAINTDYYVYAAYFNALLTYGMETSFFRFFSKEKEKGKVLSTSFISLLTTTLVFLVATLFFSSELADFFGFKNAVFFQVLISTLVLDTLVVIPFAYLRVTHKPVRFTLVKIVNIAVFALLNVFFLTYIPYAIKEEISLPQFVLNYYNSSPQVIHIFVSGLLASAVTFLILFPIIFKFKFQFDTLLFKKMFRYGAPIMVGSLAFVTNENLDKILLGTIIGDYEMGIYAACYKLGVFMTLYIMAFRLGAEPFFFNQAAKKNAPKTYAKILSWFTILGALFMLVVIVFLDTFAALLLGNPIYFKGLQIVPIILLANLFLGIYNNLSIWYKLTDKTRYGMYFSVIGAIITIVFNLVFIPKIGFIASAWATLCAYGCMTIISYRMGKKQYPVPYNLKKIGVYIFISILFSSLSYFVFRGNNFVSFVFIVLFLAGIYFNERTELKKLLLKN